MKRKKRIVEIKKIPSLEGEIWKDIKDFEGKYWVSNMGRVRGVTKILKTFERARHITVGLSLMGCPITNIYSVRALVAQAFLGYEIGKFKHRIKYHDGDTNNVQADNLKLVPIKSRAKKEEDNV